MKFRKRLQLLILSASIVSFFLCIVIFIFAGRESEKAFNQGTQLQNSLVVEDEEISFFIDSNRNQVKDSSETNCEQCATKQVLAEIVTKVGKELIIKDIDSDGTLQLRSTEVSSIWGYIADKKILIPLYNFSAKQKGTDIQIPVIQTSYELIGGNTNVSTISSEEVSEKNFETSFTFDSIIPAVNAFVNTDSPVWFVYYPNPDKTDTYYISSGLILASTDSKNRSSTYWHFLGDYSTQEDIEHYKLVIPVK